MSNALIKTDTNEMLALAKQFALSGYFTDARKAEEAFVKIMAGAELSLPPFQAMTGIHIISGKPVLGAGLIASIIKRSGKYTYRVTEQTERACTIEFSENIGGKWEAIGTSTFTLDMAKKAGVKNLDKFPQNMLFARAISNGAKWYTPDVFGGPVYAEGEIEEPPGGPVVRQVEETTATVVETLPPNESARKPSKKAATEAMQKQLASQASTPAMVTAIEQLPDWKDSIDGLKSLDDFNDFIAANGATLKPVASDDPYTRSWKDVVRSFFYTSAEIEGFVWDKEAKTMVKAPLQQTSLV